MGRSWLAGIASWGQARDANRYVRKKDTVDDMLQATLALR